MATERVEDIVSKEALDSFDQLKSKVDQSTASLDKLIAQGVELNKTFANVKVLKDLIDTTEKLKKSEDDLANANKNLTTAEKQLSDAKEKREKASRDAANATIADNQAVNDQARKVLVAAESMQALVEQAVLVRNALKSITDERKKLTKEFDSGAISQDKYNQSLSELLSTESALKLTNYQLGAAIKIVAKEADAAEGSIDQLQAQLAIAQKAYSALSAEEKKSAENVELQQKIRTLSDELNRQKKSIGDFSSNVGRYSESLGGLFDNVAREIQRLNSLKVSAANIGDPASVRRYERAIQELESVQKVSLNTNNTYTQSVRQLQKEFVNIGTAGNQSTEFVKQFRDDLGEAIDKQKNLNTEIKAASSSTKSLDLLRSGINGVIGAYQTGIGIVSLFGDATEENEKTIKRLVAVQSVANGIQEIGQQLTEHNTAAYRALTYVQGLYKVAIDASATATQRLGAALKLSVVGLLVAAVAYLIINFDKLTSSADKTKIKINELEGVSNNTKAALKEMGDTIDKIVDASLKELEDQIKNLNTELGLTPSSVEKAAGAMKLLQKEINSNNQKIIDGTSFWRLFFGGINATTGLAGAVEKQGELNHKMDDFNKKIDEATKKQAFFNQNLLNVERSKAATQTLKDAQDVNNRLIALQKTSLESRLTLTTNNYELEKRIIERALQDELTAAKDDQAKQYTAQAKFAHDSLIAERNYQTEIEKIRKEARERDAKAESDVIQRTFQSRIDFNKKIADNDKELPEIRIKALRNGLQTELQLLNEQEKRELAIDGIRESEKQNIRDKYNDQRVKAEEETSNKIFALQVEFFSKFKGEQGSLIKFVTKQLADYAEEVKRLFQTIGRDVSQAEFAKQVTEGIKEANAKIKSDFDDFGDSLAELFPRVAGQAVDDYNSQIEKLETNLRSLRDTGVDLVFSLQTDALEKQKNLIQDQINLIDVKRDKDIAAINASQKSEQDKANAIAVVNATADAKKREAERKQKEIDRKKAVIEKEASIARIVQSTAEAVMAALGEKPYKPTNIANAAIIGALGLAQIAKVVATPVPSYDVGTDFHPADGPALVHPGELMVTPQGKLVETPALPTLMNLAKGTMVLPDYKNAIADYYGGMTIQKFNELSGSNEELGELKKITQAIKSIPKTTINKKGNNWSLMTNSNGNFQKWLQQNIE